ncbi:MAG: NTP transferase domain-containing protein [Chloroflexi bacterium]|nr:NTP transferase domain-containing protein [Chloroflexota bacterium]
MQAVILAGGRGTRLRPLTERLPKCLVPIAGRPFLEYQIDLLRACGIRDIVLCVGHLGGQVVDRLGNGARFGVRLDYSWDGDRLLGTAGALKNAAALLEPEFFVTYGDSYLALDYRAVLDYFRRSDRLGLMVVCREGGGRLPGNVAVRGGLVSSYDKETPAPGMTHVNFGVTLLRRRALALIPHGAPYTEDQFYSDLIGRGQLLAYETERSFYEVGSWQGLAQFERLISVSPLLQAGA